MFANSSMTGVCPPPLLQEGYFNGTGGYGPGRFCAEVPGINVHCCLPCPVTDWMYPDDFYDQTRIPGWINLAGLFVCVLLLLCFVILPPTATRRHYLNVCLLIGIIFLELGFIIPWAQKPDQCFDEITPNDMYSNITCAFSGALIVAGGTSTAMWVVMRTLSTHLQVCWNITPGPSFFLFSQTVGWGVSGILLATELSLSGVSFRFGDYCHVNQDASLASLWGPLLGLAGLSLILQVSTLAYCLQMYIRHTLIIRQTRTIDTYGKSVDITLKSLTSGNVWSRITQMMRSQWRGLLLAFILTADVVFFSAVFILLDKQASQRNTDMEMLVPWLSCLIAQGNKNACLEDAKSIAINDNALLAVLFVLSVCGIEAAVLMFRRSMITGWLKLGKRSSDTTHFDRDQFVRQDSTIELCQVVSGESTKSSSESIRNQDKRQHFGDHSAGNIRAMPHTSSIYEKAPSWTIADRRAAMAQKTPAADISHLTKPTNQVQYMASSPQFTDVSYESTPYSEPRTVSTSDDAQFNRATGQVNTTLTKSRADDSQLAPDSRPYKVHSRNFSGLRRPKDGSNTGAPQVTYVPSGTSLSKAMFGVEDDIGEAV